MEARDLISNLKFIRKPFEWSEVDETITVEQLKSLGVDTDKLPIMEWVGGPMDIQKSFPTAEWSVGTVVIVSTPECKYLVDRQGYDYARYVIRLEEKV